MTSPAQTIWPHLAKKRVEQPQRERTSALASVMYPNQTKAARDAQRRHREFVADLRKLAQGKSIWD
jgi:hypothetical protein